jgi:hypothetical protein
LKWNVVDIKNSFGVLGRAFPCFRNGLKEPEGVELNPEKMNSKKTT